MCVTEKIFTNTSIFRPSAVNMVNMWKLLLLDENWNQHQKNMCVIVIMNISFLLALQGVLVLIIVKDNYGEESFSMCYTVLVLTRAT